MEFFTRSNSINHQLFRQISENPQSPSIHSYHRYQSLLRYITSYVYDLRMILQNMKEIVYELVGVNYLQIIHKIRLNQSAVSQEMRKNLAENVNKQNRSNIDLSSNRIYHENDCEIQFMMKNCHNIKDDLLKVNSLIRGYQSGLQNIGYCENCLNQLKQKTPLKNKAYENQSKLHYHNKRNCNQDYNRSNSESLSQERPSVPILSSCKSQVDLDQIGFLTFREMADENNYNKNITTPIKLQTTNKQTQPWTNDPNKQIQPQIKQPKINKTVGRFKKNQDLWQDSLNLINMIRIQLSTKESINI